jgi:hypoxanthine phosphoribosyltransferase
MKELVPENFVELYTKEDIQIMVNELAEKIRNSYSENDELVCVGVLKGAWVFHADLVRALNRPVQVDFIRATSYGHGTQTSGVVRILKDIETDISDKHILVIEEIIDSGRTLKFIKERLMQSHPKSVKIAALLDKKERREVECEADFVGTQVPNHFVVGYGLDWGEKFRNLQAIYKVEGEKLH